MKLSFFRYAIIFILAISFFGCEFSLKPPKGLRSYFKTEADSRYYEKKCRNLLRQISSNLSEYEVRRIAVIDFVDIENKVSELGRFLSDKLMLQIPKESSLIVIQRGHVEKALKELRVLPMESYSFEATNQLGKKLGVDGLIVGKIVDLGTNIDVNLKLIDVNTGDVITTASESLARTKYAIEMSTKYTE